VIVVVGVVLFIWLRLGRPFPGRRREV
jgi:hypothetical protein